MRVEGLKFEVVGVGGDDGVYENEGEKFPWIELEDPNTPRKHSVIYLPIERVREVGAMLHKKVVVSMQIVPEEESCVCLPDLADGPE